MQHNCIYMKHLFSFFVLPIVFASTALAQNLAGKIIDIETRQSIPGATVTLVDIGSSTVTDESGNFEFDGKLPETVQLLIQKKGYTTYSIAVSYPSTGNLIIELAPSHVELDEVVIVSSRGTLQKETVTHIENRKLADLNTVKSTNLGEALSKIPGVYAASTGNGISKPVIRGLSGTRVITLLNGIRIENQQWGSDHGMGITALGVGSVEIVKGPASLYYGSDALGGVVYFVDESYAKSGYVEEKFGSSFEFNGLNSQSYAGVKFADNKFRMNVFAGYNSASDFRLPNKNYLVNSRYQDKLAKISMGYVKGNWVTNLRYTYLNSHVGIPGESEDSIVTPLSFQSDVTKRKIDLPFQFIENHVVSWENKFLFKAQELQINIGNTYNSLNEFEDDANNASLAMRLNSTVYTLKYKRYIFKGSSITAGIQGMDQQNRNSKLAEERLIPNANSVDNGAFAVLDFKLGSKLTIQTGIRGDLRSINVKDDSIHFSKNYTSLNYSAGILRVVNKSTFRLNLSSGFRAPHTSELLANGAHEGALRYEIGSVNLKTEQATQLDFTYEYGNEHISLVFNPFFSQINNYIYLNPVDSVIDNKPVYHYEQTDQVALYGTDFGIHLHPHKLHGLHLESTYSYVRGEQHSGTSLPFIPQSRIITLIKIPLTGYSSNAQSKDGYFAIQHSYYFAQERVSEFETPTKAYSLLDLSFNLEYEKKNGRKMKIGGGVKNVFNTAYFNHLSSLKNIGIQQQGRNFYLSLAFDLEQKQK